MVHTNAWKEFKVGTYYFMNLTHYNSTRYVAVYTNIEYVITTQNMYIAG